MHLISNYKHIGCLPLIRNLNIFINKLNIHQYSYIDQKTGSSFQTTTYLVTLNTANILKHFLFFILILKNSLIFNYNSLIDLTCVDRLGELDKIQDLYKNRFSLIYIFMNMKQKNRLILNLTINKNDKLMSLSKFFESAIPLEREVYDLFGVIFFLHPDLRRILTDYGYNYNPLLKDFPLTGFIELKYNEILKSIEYNPVKLVQEYRLFNFESPWKDYKNDINFNYKFYL